MNYSEYSAQQQAEAEAFLQQHADSIPAVILVGSDMPSALGRDKSDSMARLHTDPVTNQRRLNGLTATGSASSTRDGSEPTDDLANSLNDPDLLGFYHATSKQAEMATRARASVGGLDSSGRPRKGTRRTKAQMAEARAAKRAAAAIVRR